MSIVTVQIGQCGNQVGSQFFATLMDDLNAPIPGCNRGRNEAYRESCLKCFFNVDEENGGQLPEARAVMVDMEPKVIAKSLADAKRSGTWTYAKKQQFCLKRGSGNNWAHGYAVHGPRVRESVMDLVRREVEKCDHFAGFLTLLSLAGGTGSGVGTLITEALRDEYPHSFILDQVVAPYSTGEVIVQNYNAVLTLSHLYQVTDGLLVVQNDIIHKICSQLLGLSKVSFRDINKVVSHQMACLMQPACEGMTGSRHISSVLGDMLENVVPHPEYKLLSMRTIPQMSEKSKLYSTYQWHGLLKHLRQMLIANAPMEEGINWSVKASASHRNFNHSLANLVVLRGMDLPSVDVSPFHESHLYPSWVPPGGQFQTWTQQRPFCGYERSALLLSNSQSPVASLDTMTGKAWSMFASRAYVHQYLKHGMAEEQFVDSFACMEQVVNSYKHL